MKSNLEILLGEWGYWKVGEEHACLGYPDSVSFSRMRVDGQRRADPDVFLVDDDLRRLDKAINDLHPDAKIVIVAHYVWPGPVKRNLDRLQVSRTTYYSNLEHAHRQLSHVMGGKYATEPAIILSGHLAQLSG